MRPADGVVQRNEGAHVASHGLVDGGAAAVVLSGEERESAMRRFEAEDGGEGRRDPETSAPVTAHSAR